MPVPFTVDKEQSPAFQETFFSDALICTVHTVVQRPRYKTVL